MQPTRTHYIKLLTPPLKRERISGERLSPEKTLKPETVVIAEIENIRQRYSFEPLHYHEPDETTCKVCGKSGFMTWTDNEGLFNRDTFRCGSLP